MESNGPITESKLAELPSSDMEKDNLALLAANIYTIQLPCA